MIGAGESVKEEHYLEMQRFKGTTQRRALADCVCALGRGKLKNYCHEWSSKLQMKVTCDHTSSLLTEVTASKGVIHVFCFYLL
nr:hypothetical protein Itr_chr02CG07840 [Ipomoea trifida]GMC64047.1 hypothetical protein Iba_chr02dCG1190 [Ipomoea batatas]